FDRALAPATVRIATRSPAEGDKGRMIGFGCAAWNDSGTSGQKRAGNVTISGVDSGTINASENAVYGCPGDSGGPLFNQEGEQIGVASTAGEGATSGYGQTNWVDLTSKSTSGFLAYAASGAGDSLAQNNPPRQENNQPQQGNHQPQQQNNQGYANNFTLNGITYSCPAGYYLATDGYCYRA
ncbi:hypothetical protein EBZ80_26935, partial [bacterium]|nr:hypothetical protein [bacterium]